jgi:hypothetical protein
MSRRYLPSFRIAFVAAATLAGTGAAHAQQPAPFAQQSPSPATKPAPFAQQPAPVAPSNSAPAQQPAPAAAGNPAPAPQPTAAKPLPGAPAASSEKLKSSLDEPPTPATIDVDGDTLSIKATNASLTDVLRQVASRTGMQIEGNSRDERVYGVYGPGSPSEVLTSLLYDSGYNVLMVGETGNGAPRRLVLSPRTLSASIPAASPTSGHDEDDDETPAEAAPVQTAPPPFVPGAAQGASTTAPGQVKTPQQMLQELQRLNQQQQQQQQNQPQ